MKFLQTSDWHLGKTFHEVNLYEDQQFFLDQIFDELKKEKENGSAYDGFLVPGDIYDRPIPPSDAVTMLSSFLGKIHKEFPELEIFLLSGNHDSAERLSFLKGILSELKIHIKTDIVSFMEPVLLEKGNEKCAVYQLPFLYSGAFFDESGNSIKKQDDLYKFACEKIFQAHSQNCPDSSSVICAHLMTVKSIVSDSERSFVGTAEEVNASYFECFDYSAVGHLHSYQTAGKKKNVVYSGAPLAYSFDDKDERFMLSIEVHKDEVPVIKSIPIKPLHKVVRLSGSFKDFYGTSENKELIKKHENDFVEILITDSVVPEGAVSLLRTNFKNLLSFRRESKTELLNNSEILKRTKAVESNNPEVIFEGFISELYGDEKNRIFETEKKEFLMIAKENDWEGGL